MPITPEDIIAIGTRGPWPRTKWHLDELINYIRDQKTSYQLAAIDYWIGGLMLARAIIEGGPEVEKFIREG